MSTHTNDQHVHHWTPKRDGKTPDGEPAYIQACDCGMTHKEYRERVEEIHRAVIEHERRD